MATLIAQPTRIEAAGTPPKTIEEFIGRVNSNTENLSVARMTSPPGWQEPGQTPAFDEYSLVLSGCLRVSTRSGVLDVRSGQAVITPKGKAMTDRIDVVIIAPITDTP